MSPYQRPLPSKQTVLTRYGGWIPANPAVYDAFFNDLLREIDPKKAHVPAVQNFKDNINADPELVDLFEQVFLQVSPESRVSSHFCAIISYSNTYSRSEPSNSCFFAWIRSLSPLPSFK